MLPKRLREEADDGEEGSSRLEGESDRILFLTLVSQVSAFFVKDIVLFKSSAQALTVF